jgi:CRP-like cAMP-binding protein
MAAPAPFQLNGILAPLRDDDLRTIAADLQEAPFGIGDIVYEQDAPLERVFFPTTAVLSVLKLMQSGAAVETAAVGREGVVGFEALFGAAAARDKTICQVPGMTYTMTVERFNDHVRDVAAFRQAVHTYCRLLLEWLAQSIACNRLHHVDQRCAKWLLTTQDRVGRATFPMTHEFLSMMLGVNRPSVTLAAADIQDAGFIRYSRGVMTVVDRAGLEGIACECYATQSRAFADSLRGPLADGKAGPA